MPTLLADRSEQDIGKLSQTPDLGIVPLTQVADDVDDVAPASLQGEQ